ncbi:T9SS type A sorting domain-containing protein [Fulvivirgaceae bacterium PWU5]|uniref:T9SS type A sorting domain-containing protein n=1 Tax=Dawidia cretensis TaxID=2782350 RepID=A0AAP2E0B6_9BACT|nr:CARDB domain-containing protein [Dawidia cretensis]MBT1709563.1 T9SS type A sorting domain-containing protein [Dawidia cretensis]
MKRSLCVIFLLLLQVSTYAQDLITEGVTAPTSVDRYQTFDVSTTVKNNSATPTGGSTLLKVKLSFDAVLSPDDPEIGNSNAIAAIGANGTRAVTVSCYTGNIAAGNYYLILQIDPNNTVAETDDNNNVAIFPGYTVNMQNVDLLFTGLTPAVTTIPAGDQLTVDYALQNTGTTDLGQSTSSTFYLSTDNILDAGDRFVYTHDIPLAGPDVFNETVTLNIPAVPLGDYFLIAKADDDHGVGSVDELDETNNTIAAALTIGASNIDLDVTNNAPPAPGFTSSGGTGLIELEYDLVNNGSTGVGGYDAHVYISEDQTLDAGDYDLTADLKPDLVAPDYLAAGAWKVAYVTQTVPNINTLIGTHYIIWKINATNAIPETDYTNNILVSATTITVTPVQPAIQINSITFTSAPYDNTDVTFDFSLSIQNTGPINSFTQSFEILIRDDDNNIVYTGSRPNEPFAFALPNATITKNWSITLPGALAAGDYSLEVRCDPDEDCYSNTQSTPLEIEQAPYVITGTIIGSDGTNISSGTLYLYHKAVDGTITREQTVPITSSNTFSLTVTDTDPRALYFFPNTITYGAFAPTLSGNYTYLRDEAFFTPILNTVSNLTPGRATSAPAGSRNISGVAKLPGETPAPGVPLLLYDGTTLVQIVYTDAAGNYSFANLAAKTYTLVPAVALDNYIIDQAYSMDVSAMNIEANIAIETDYIDVTVIFIKLSQTITFNTLSDKVYTDAPFDPQATASSGLAITYESSNTDVAEITGNLVVIRGIGTTTITAYQEGNGSYDPATPVGQSLTVNKAPQTITFGNLATKKPDDADFTLAATASSSLPVTFTSSNLAVATVEDNVVSLHGEGETDITASQDGDEYFLAAPPVTRTLRVSSVVTGIDNNPLAGVRLYPNPTSGILTLETAVPVQQVSITDLAGRVQSFGLADDVLDIRHLPTGIYLVTLQDKKHTKIVKVIKK